MQTAFHELTNETKTLLFEMNTMYLKCDKNDAKTSRAFLNKYHDEIQINADPVKGRLAILEEFGYIKNQSNGGLLAPTHKGLRYKEARLIYWKHKAVGPATVSVVVSFAYQFITDNISHIITSIKGLWLQFL